MNSTVGLFSIVILLSVFWSVNSVPQRNIGGMDAEGNIQNDNRGGVLSEIETEDKKGMSVNGHGNTVSGEDTSEVKRFKNIWNNYWKARSAWVDEIRRRGSNNGMMMTMESRVGSKTGMSSSKSASSKINNGMSASVGSSTNGMSTLTGTGTGYNNKMDFSMATNSNFNSGMAAATKNGNSFSSGVVMPLDTSMNHEPSSGMPGSNPSSSMVTGFSSNSQNGMVMGSNTDLKFGIDTESSAGMNTNGGIEASSSNVERSEDGKIASVS